MGIIVSNQKRKGSGKMDHLIQGSELNKMRDVDIQSVDKNTLVDIRNIKIDDTLSGEEKISQYVKQIKNPYCFKVGDVAVKVTYQDKGPSFKENFENMIMAL